MSKILNRVKSLKKIMGDLQPDTLQNSLDLTPVGFFANSKNDDYPTVRNWFYLHPVHKIKNDGSRSAGQQRMKKIRKFGYLRQYIGN